MKTLTALMCCFALGLLAGGALAQEAPKPQEPHQGMAPMSPKPGPEHDVLQKDAGVWDATVEMFIPNAPPSVSKGTETNILGPGGLWLITDFKSDMMGQPFQGHGVSGYDPNKRKYVGTWVDSMSTGLSITESTYDKAANNMTGWLEGPDHTGKMMKMKAVTEYKDADTRIFTMYMHAPDGQLNQTMRITYKRRK